MSNKAHDIFISYARGDATFAEELADGLLASGLKVWLDLWNIPPGSDFEEAILKGLSDSAVVGVCVGPGGADSLSTRLDSIQESVKRNPGQVVLPILVGGAGPEAIPAQLKELSALKNVGPDTDKVFYRLAGTLVSMGEFPAATHLLQLVLPADDDKRSGLFDSLKRLIGKADAPKQGATPEPEAETLADRRPADRSNEEAALLAVAAEFLRGAAGSPRELLALAVKLKAVRQFGYARRLLARARHSADLREHPRLRLKIQQQLALCTYKDPGLPTDSRLDRALEILHEVEDLSDTRNQETLGLVGAIFKRKWEVDSQRQHLERALFYYLRGYAEGVENDQGYTGLNAAYILDLLAHQEEITAGWAGVPSESAEGKRAKAAAIREEIVREVAPLVNQPGMEWLQGKWWFYSTIGEAYFGLGIRDKANYEEAVAWLRRGVKESSVPEWELESTVRQLASMARIQARGDVSGAELEGTPPWEAMKSFLGRTVPVRSAFIGRIGLGLSGGGFRASLYHIGVLAKLAELDVLRHVEVLSCVSGGSLVGAHYYLELRHLLQAKRDEEITREDYVKLVRRVMHDFLRGVQRNIRVRVAAEPWTNLRAGFEPGYSRTTRAGELFESEIFSRVSDGAGRAPRFINDLYVRPKGEGPDFRPKYHNWRREAKVPVLTLSATTLNTGHTWHFTASYMGEPPAGVGSEIDVNDRLRRVYYEDAPEGYRRIRLGQAVAASACVPELFEPVTFEGLYPDRVIKLVDGGISDSQGVSALLEQDCDVILISDGSVQMKSLREPSSGVLGVPVWSTSILQARVRQSQYEKLAALRRSRLLRSFMFVHLNNDLDAEAVDWVDSMDPLDADDDARPAHRRGPLTRYGIAKDIQQSLASVRTDLDSFSDIEAYALMTSGYRQTEYTFGKGGTVWGLGSHDQQFEWDFLAVEDGMKGIGRSYQYVKRLLSVSGAHAFKVWKLRKSLQALAFVLAAASLALVTWAAWTFRDSILLKAVTVGAVWMFLLTLALTTLAAALVGKKLLGVEHLDEKLYRAATGILTAVLGWPVAWIHLRIFDPMFLRDGSLYKYTERFHAGGRYDRGSRHQTPAPGRTPDEPPAVPPEPPSSASLAHPTTGAVSDVLGAGREVLPRLKSSDAARGEDFRTEAEPFPEYIDIETGKDQTD
jgi:predicted acylesterase/phospholipase RssA